MDRGGDSGAATVFACFALIGLIVVTVMLVHVGVVVSARHQAQSGADLGALAAAGALDSGAGVACARAGTVARRMSAAVVSCEVTGWEVVVAVEQNVALGVLGSRTVRASARAGPAE